MKFFLSLFLVLTVAFADAQFTVLGITFGGKKVEWYSSTVIDADGDGDYGSQTVDSIFQKKSPGANYSTSRPAFFTVFDCDDHNNLWYHNNAEVCNGIDDNCDGITETRYHYYYDRNGDGFGDSPVDTVTLCDAAAPAGYTLRDPVTPDVYFTTRGPLNLNLHGLSMETGHVDDNNKFINWYDPTYFSRAQTYAATVYAWPGSSWSHSLYWLPGDTIASGTGRIGNGVNGKYLYWDQPPISSLTPLTAPLFVDKNAVLNGINKNNYQVSFFPYAVGFAKAVNAKMILIINDTPFDWPGTKRAIIYMKHQGVFSGWVAASMESTGSMYKSNTFFPNGGTDYVNKVVNPLHDSLAVYFSGCTVIADVDDPQKNPTSKWNVAVKTSKADAVRAYFTSDEIKYSPGQSDDTIKEHVVNRILAFQNAFPGKMVYIAQWNFADSFLTAYFEKVLIDFDADHPGVILASIFNGMKNIGFENKQTAAGYPGLTKSAQLFHPGAITLTAQTNYASFYAVASKSTDGKLTIEYLNHRATPVVLNYISVDGFISQFNQTIPANSVTVIKF